MAGVSHKSISVDLSSLHSSRFTFLLRILAIYIESKKLWEEDVLHAGINMSACTLAFTLQNDFAQFAPRLGTLSLQRLDGTSTPEIQTPGFITASSRGVVPHLSRDHVKMTNAIRLTNIPFESL